MSDTLVIIPTYNEKENIEAIIRAVFNQKKEFHVLVVDDNSPDGTATIVDTLIENEFSNRLFIEKRAGKNGLGTAYIHGFKWALKKEYGYIIEMDADFSHNPKDLKRLYKSCAKKGNDVSVGSRYSKGVNVVNWPMHRVLLSYFASKYVRFITGIPLHDTTAGFVCWKRKVLETMNLDKIEFVGYAFQIEMKFKAWKRKFKVDEVSVVFTDRTLGESKMSGNIVYEALFGVIKMRLKGLPK
ncbi:polyprenol monophosphomannose synthase [Lutibacter sp. Hel_I_33_5]|uniref:polyprenol monophosphomannose synthase n=1 Tax=Lutibacter sp. Hel_I_33_5 TaxID=1566289 RepID=UPI00119EF12E|nr:polyprenol monophosphomannose synthase [Lutibacter sp. Hel_I_33_5]